MDIYQGMNENQLKVRDTINGIIQVDAIPGSGKCIVGDSIIFTDTGMKRIEEIPYEYWVNQQDECKATIVGYNDLGMSKYQTSHWYNMGESDTIKIKTGLGYEIEGTPEHPILVVGDEGVPIFKKLGEISTEDSVIISCDNNLWGSNNSITEEVAYRTGLLADRRIPNIILDSPRNIVIKCLQGIFDTDGSIDEDGTVEYSSKSLQLIKDIRMCLINLGIPSRLEHKKSYKIVMDELNGKLFASIVGFGHCISKINRAEVVKNSECKDTTGLVPNLEGQIARLMDKQKHLDNPIMCYITGEQKPSRSALQRIVSNCTDDDSTELKLLSFYASSCFVDSVVLIRESRNVVYDFTVPGSHSFVSNGIISHNTHTVVRKVAYMIENGVKPKNIMLTTFTKKASEELKERLEQVVSKMSVMQMTIGTTHSIAYRILKKEYKNSGDPLIHAFESENGIISGVYQQRFCEDIKKSMIKDRTVPFSVKEQLRDTPIPRIIKTIGYCKNCDMSISQYCKENKLPGNVTEMYLEFCREYEETKKYQNILDMDDLLPNLLMLLQNNKEVCEKYQKMYKYIIVDEAQDNNVLQYHLIRLLAKPDNNILLVGDTDQCMYGFRGSRPDEFMNLSSYYSSITPIQLVENYRSQPQILEIANQLINHNHFRLSKDLIPSREQGEESSVYYNEYENDEEEALSIADEIETLYKKGNLNFKDVSILYRCNAQSRAIEDALIGKGIPYVIHSGISFYERKEVKDIIAYLKLAINPHDNNSFCRIYNTPSRYLGKAFISKLKAVKNSHYDALSNNIVYLKDYERANVQELLNLINDLIELRKQQVSITEMISTILNEGGYLKYLQNEGDEEDEGNSRVDNIETLKHASTKYKTLESFIDYIDLMMSESKISINGVQCMTIHKAKGLEYPIVFIASVSEGCMPHFRAVEKSRDTGEILPIEEERRFMFVASTRAKDLLYISSVGMLNGKSTRPSRFIREMGLSTTPGDRE